MRLPKPAQQRHLVQKRTDLRSSLPVAYVELWQVMENIAKIKYQKINKIIIKFRSYLKSRNIDICISCSTTELFQSSINRFVIFSVFDVADIFFLRTLYRTSRTFCIVEQDEFGRNTLGMLSEVAVFQ